MWWKHLQIEFYLIIFNGEAVCRIDKRFAKEKNKANQVQMVGWKILRINSLKRLKQPA